MSAIRTMCPHCICPVELDPAEILLLSGPPPQASGSYAYYCRSCQQVTVAPVSPNGLALLVSAGVDVQQRTAAPPPPADPLTIDDLIDFHRLLDTQDWFGQLQRLH
jgi:hypothetical protein